MRKIVFSVLAMCVLSACVPVEGVMEKPVEGQLASVPESLQALAAPGQDLSVVRINPADGCYEYRHIGPVETTFLPLRTAEGRPICTQASA